MASRSKGTKRDEPAALRKYKNRKHREQMEDEFAEQQIRRMELVGTIGNLLRERHPKVYEELKFYFGPGDPGMTITMDWEALAAILFIEGTDEHDKGEFEPAE